MTKVTYFTNEHGVEFTIRTFETIGGFKSAFCVSGTTKMKDFGRTWAWADYAEAAVIRHIEKTYA